MIAFQHEPHIHKRQWKFCTVLHYLMAHHCACQRPIAPLWPIRSSAGTQKHSDILCPLASIYCWDQLEIKRQIKIRLNLAQSPYTKSNSFTGIRCDRVVSKIQQEYHAWGGDHNCTQSNWACFLSIRLDKSTRTDHSSTYLASIQQAWFVSKGLFCHILKSGLPSSISADSESFFYRNLCFSWHLDGFKSDQFPFCTFLWVPTIGKLFYCSL